MKTKKSISDDIRAATQLRAYYIWVREGRPIGRGAAHWALAEAEILGEQPVEKAAAATVPEPPAPKHAAPKKAPVAKTAAAAKPAVEAPVKATKTVKTKKAIKSKKAPAHKR